HERFSFFCRAALALFKHLNWPPDIIHGSDWPCGFGMIESRSRRRYDPFFSKTRTLFSIHNMAYQGAFDPGDLWWLGFGEQPDRNDFMLGGAASALKAGLIASDALSAVSRRYALEIQTPEQGYGLDWLLRSRSDRLVGITNGADYGRWNPASDARAAAKFEYRDRRDEQVAKA